MRRVVSVFAVGISMGLMGSCSANGGDPKEQIGMGTGGSPAGGKSGTGGSANGGSFGASGGTSSWGGTAASGGSINVAGSGSGASPADASDGDACGASTITADVIPGEVLVIFDQSLSMSQMWGTKPKWLAASDALFAAVQTLGDSINVGALFVPNYCPPTTPTRPNNCTDPTGTGPCSLVYPISDPANIAIEPGTQFLQKWVAHFQPPWTTISGTPWDQAFAQANNAFPAAATNGAERAVVLLSDGAPTCPIGDATPTLPQVAALLSKGIKTFVIGVPGAAADAAVLNQVAQTGGTNQYIDAAQPTQVTQAFSELSKTVIGCVFQFDPPPPALDDVHMIGWDAQSPGGFEVTQGADGWQLSADGTTATLLGATCDKAKTGGFDKIEFIFGCPSAVIQPPR